MGSQMHRTSHQSGGALTELPRGKGKLTHRVQDYG